jgi:ATP-dependent DNA helicase RecQ
VATVRLGMGYDKGDIGFVIHYQCPSSIISYYQQIGRAGRNIDCAYAILMFGKEDRQINEYFIDTAFPKKEDCESVLEVIRNNDGISKSKIKYYVNIENKEIEKVLMFLENEDAIFIDSNKYYATINDYTYNEELYTRIKEQKLKEYQQMIDLLNTKECYSKFIVNCLDDYSAKECGKCSNCLKETIFDNHIELSDIDEALAYVNSLLIKIEPRKRWTKSDYTGNLNIEYVNQDGIALSKYSDVGYGELVKEDKYQNKQFRDELVGKSADVLRKIVKENNITALTFVPSLRSDIVKDFAQRLAKKLNIDFIDSLIKKPARPQKFMQNSAFQCDNAFKSFYFNEKAKLPKNILLVDDMIDSKWTMTVCGYRLMQNGAKNVYPFALAESSKSEE